jgi:alkanesulfonate monooxygenase SsuD/methylene tetrahydromethanopterin reductase-like flavin-dependent oxidoreductase (luciferase family)
MRIGLITPLNGRPDGDRPPPTWESVARLAHTAEDVGFDMFVYEDALLYRGAEATNGLWESMAISAGLAVETDRISYGQSVVNSPYRSPAHLAKIAETLDEMSGGRYVLGIGAGNTEDSDYRAFGFPTDKRYSRFAEAIEIIHSLLKTGAVDFQGDFYSALDAELVLRGPSATGPRINIAAGGPKMLRLVARYADEWNWWTWDETIEQLSERMAPILEELESACAEVGRDQATLTHTIDLYSVVPPGSDVLMPKRESPVGGGVDGIVAYIAALREMGFTEVRCDLGSTDPAAVEAMAPVVEAVHGL